MEYNGHKNWNYWNVALWIGNDQNLYNCAKQCLANNANRRAAAREFIGVIGTDKTPDGAKYTLSAVYAALEDL